MKIFQIHLEYAKVELHGAVQQARFDIDRVFFDHFLFIIQPVGTTRARIETAGAKPTGPMNKYTDVIVEFVVQGDFWLNRTFIAFEADIKLLVAKRVVSKAVLVVLKTRRISAFLSSVEMRTPPVSSQRSAIYQLS